MKVFIAVVLLVTGVVAHDPIKSIYENNAFFTGGISANKDQFNQRLNYDLTPLVTKFQSSLDNYYTIDEIILHPLFNVYYKLPLFRQHWSHPLFQIYVASSAFQQYWTIPAFQQFFLNPVLFYKFVYPVVFGQNTNVDITDWYKPAVRNYDDVYYVNHNNQYDNVIQRALGLRTLEDVLGAKVYKEIPVQYSVDTVGKFQDFDRLLKHIFNKPEVNAQITTDVKIQNPLTEAKQVHKIIYPTNEDVFVVENGKVEDEKSSVFPFTSDDLNVPVLSTTFDELQQSVKVNDVEPISKDAFDQRNFWGKIGLENKRFVNPKTPIIKFEEPITENLKQIPINLRVRRYAHDEHVTDSTIPCPKHGEHVKDVPYHTVATVPLVNQPVYYTHQPVVYHHTPIAHVTPHVLTYKPLTFTNYYQQPLSYTYQQPYTYVPATTNYVHQTQTHGQPIVYA